MHIAGLLDLNAPRRAEPDFAAAPPFTARGFCVVIGSRSSELGEAAAKSVGGDARAVQLDVTDQASIAVAAERIRKEFGRLDVLVNNAGIAQSGKPGKTLEEVVQSAR